MSDYRRHLTRCADAACSYRQVAREAAEAVVAGVRGLHTPVPGVDPGSHPWSWCAVCDDVYPCATILALVVDDSGAS